VLSLKQSGTLRPNLGFPLDLCAKLAYYFRVSLIDHTEASTMSTTATPISSQRSHAARAVKVPRKSERLVTRATPELKNLAQRAADLEGRSLTDFVAASVQVAAERTIREREVTRVSSEYARAFAAAILNPPMPNTRAHEAAAFFDTVLGGR
jgi:uncharacterized protein (DUF1778 family)